MRVVVKSIPVTSAYLLPPRIPSSESVPSRQIDPTAGETCAEVSGRSTGTRSPLSGGIPPGRASMPDPYHIQRRLP